MIFFSEFNDNSSSLKTFYNAASIVCEVNASHDDFEQIYKDVELALFETLETVIVFKILYINS